MLVKPLPVPPPQKKVILLDAGQISTILSQRDLLRCWSNLNHPITDKGILLDAGQTSNTPSQMGSWNAGESCATHHKQRDVVRFWSYLYNSITKGVLLNAGQTSTTSSQKGILKC
ncbi:hypothetical protein RRG08_009584 [Elysia crispata]|uniref:Uncharacterized protein n=1 Tax=Elysia crispata TaxID=231223 RepID=A0AAE0XU60_9GAST|nr:hypothetical protein RRG08_009584 [Elysia crispata]